MSIDQKSFLNLNIIKTDKQIINIVNRIFKNNEFLRDILSFLIKVYNILLINPVIKYNSSSIPNTLKKIYDFEV